MVQSVRQNNEYLCRGILSQGHWKWPVLFMRGWLWTNGFLHALPQAPLFLQNLSWVCSPTLWRLAFSSLAPLCYSICFLVLPHFTAVRWHLTLPGSRCWEKPVPKQPRLWEMQSPAVLPSQSRGQDRLRCHTSVVVLSPITRPFWEFIEIIHIKGPNYSKLNIWSLWQCCPLWVRFAG